MPQVGTGKAARHFAYTPSGHRKAKAHAKKVGKKVLLHGTKLTGTGKPKAKATKIVKPKPKAKPKKSKMTYAEKYKKKIERRRARGKD